jgi:hypothetical protein
MSELKWNWAYYPYLDPPEKQAESALKAGYIKVVNKSEADKVIAELEEERRWRKFPEEKPEWGKEVLVIDDAGDFHIVRFSHDFKWVSWGKMNTCESDCVTYWMPLPKVPEAEK